MRPPPPSPGAWGAAPHPTPPHPFFFIFFFPSPSPPNPLPHLTLAPPRARALLSLNAFLSFFFSSSSPLPPPPPLTARATTHTVGDVHGDLGKCIAALEIAGVLAEDERRSPVWTGGDAVVVQLGDVLDRGDNEIGERGLAGVREEREGIGRKGRARGDGVESRARGREGIGGGGGAFSRHLPLVHPILSYHIHPPTPHHQASSCSCATWTARPGRRAGRS